MKTRIITGILAFLLFIPFVIKGNNYFLFSSILLSTLTIYEIIKITFKKFDILLFLSALSILTSIFFREQFLEKQSYVFVAIAIFLLFIKIIITEHSIKVAEISILIFLTFYVCIGFYSLFLLRNIDLAILLYLLVTIWVTDSGAYFGGINFGKRKLAPKLSPKKSIEGSIIGTLSSIFVAIIFFLTTNIFSNILLAIITTIFISILGQIGDLIESAYKREFNVKDSSNILPGHGGIFDRFDSVILTAPALILIFNFLNF